MVEMKSSYKTLVGKTMREKPLGRPRHRWGEYENGSYGNAPLNSE
jgi:hypothetical protein